MTRKRKLLTAGFILALGFILAWPFRKTGADEENSYAPVELPTKILRANNGDPIAGAKIAPVNEISGAPQQVMARMASTNDPTKPSLPNSGLESFDLANHPALAQREDTTTEATTPTPEVGSENSTLPAYSTAGPTAPRDDQNAWPAELIHVVANGDTLEKLAERYLNDVGRALEIFDLNRDQLSNPHLLPIGVELRVPAAPNRIID